MGGMEEYQKSWWQRQKMLKQIERLRKQIPIESNGQRKAQLTERLKILTKQFDKLFGAPPKSSWKELKTNRTKTPRIKQSRRF